MAIKSYVGIIIKRFVRKPFYCCKFGAMFIARGLFSLRYLIHKNVESNYFGSCYFH